MKQEPSSVESGYIRTQGISYFVFSLLFARSAAADPATWFIGSGELKWHIPYLPWIPLSIAVVCLVISFFFLATLFHVSWMPYALHLALWLSIPFYTVVMASFLLSWLGGLSFLVNLSPTWFHLFFWAGIVAFAALVLYFMLTPAHRVRPNNRGQSFSQFLDNIKRLFKGTLQKLRSCFKLRFRLQLPELKWIKFCLTRSWNKGKVSIRSRESLQFLLIFIAIVVIQMIGFLLPAFKWLPAESDTDSFLKVLWQVHASILGVTVVVVTIVITVIANEKDRTRTWKLYADRTWFVPIIWFNLLAIISEGIASLQAGHVINPIFPLDKIGNLILSEGFLLIASIAMAAILFTVTVKFLDDDYVEDLAEKRIMRAMPDALEADLEHAKELISRLRGGAGGH